MLCGKGCQWNGVVTAYLEASDDEHSDATKVRWKEVKEKAVKK